MLLLAALVSTAAWLCGFAQEIPVQSPLSLTKSKGSVYLECHFKDVSVNFDVTYIHWYQQKANKAPERILYLSGTTKVVDEGFQEHRYRVEKLSSQEVCILTINDVTPDDTATYYCAYWYDHCGGDAQAAPVQTPELQRQVKRRSASTACEMNSEATIHWYKQHPGEPPKRILYMSEQSPAFDDSGKRRRFQAQKPPTEPLYGLTIDSLMPRDSGTCYCACRFYQGITELDGER
ncbi:immunoglobulin kappa light chain-like [Chroicocephalus ridibundus]|uniref:immunoglobulin kappa light chain-like n=1 Tax=Chroicocephalus ridibundus TaxID=1192867 RepID=UPI002FDCA0A7